VRLHPQSRVDAYVNAGWWHDGPEWTWDGLFRARLAQRPDAVAVVDPANREALLGTAPRRLSWRELDREVDRFAALLAARGVRPDSVVGTQLPNTVELVVAYLACARLGAIVSPFPMAYREYELAQLGAVAGLCALVTVGRCGTRPHAAEARDVADRLGGDVAVLAWGTPRDLPDGVGDAGGTTVEGSVVPPRSAPPRHGHPADVVTLCWTSGTEATPKGVPRCANGWTTIGQGCTEAADLTGDDVILSPFPLVNMAGFGGILLPWLLTGARLVQHHPFDLPTYLAQVADERVTYTLAPPALLTAMLRAPDVLDAADLSSLRVIGSGSAPLSGELIRGWAARGVEVTNFFGSNEGVPLVADARSVPDPDRRAVCFPWFGRSGTSWDNTAAAGLRSRLVDPRTGEEVTEPGRAGELRVTGPTVFAGYWGGGGDPFDEQGWYRSGDLFAIDEQEPTLLRYVDRARDLIVRGGMNISPAELEALLGTHPGVAEVAVVGVPDSRMGERTAMAVVPAAGPVPTLEDLLAHLREQHIASYKLPERLQIVNALPRNVLGKVLKRQLRRRLTGV